VHYVRSGFRPIAVSPLLVSPLAERNRCNKCNRSNGFQRISMGRWVVVAHSVSGPDEIDGGRLKDWMPERKDAILLRVDQAAGNQDRSRERLMR
jgi:hypothetical protein